ncbi:MAG TPA: hypothetical protein VMS32_08485 [Verrucomicrobiae bacterium]|nr:hypothetical protein [Verrucomicrobiae bacterium]
MRRFLMLVLAFALTAPAAAAPSTFNDLQWRMIGPWRGGRALAVAGVPGDPEHFYFGAVDGGVWETRNAGRTWAPLFDGENVGSIGAIALAPSDPRTIYVGSGEADMRSDVAYGIGMFKSTDAGKTWTHIGLDDTRQIGSIVVDPHDSNVVYVAALGHQYGPNAQRGVFKTTDGGATWSKVLYRDADTGAIDLAMDPADSQTLFASLWQTRRPPWNVYPPSNGPGSGLYVTHDGGATWSHVTRDLPANVGHIGISFSAAGTHRVYLNVDSDAAHGGIYRSDDGGATWTLTDNDPRIWQRGWYFGGITADPKDPDVVYVMDTATYRSSDGGKKFDAIKGAPGGDDYHTLWIDPNDANRMILGSDQGVIVSVDRAQTWSSWYNQPTGQFYHVATDNRFPYWVYGAQQDSGAIMVLSASRHRGVGPLDWRPIDVGGENGYIATDPQHPGTAFGGSVTAENVDTGAELTVDPTLAHPGTIWRNTWTLPLAFSPADKTSLYFGRQNVFRSRDRGKSWQIVSPDLTRTGANVPPNLDPSTIAGDNGISRHGVVYAIAPSPLDARLIWAGTDDGLIWITRDGGAHWKNVSPRGLSAWSKVGIIDASHFDRNVAYAAIDRHRLDDLRPYIYRTRDGGSTWSPIVNGIPAGSFVNVVREDPKRRGLLYAGTQTGTYVSSDDGNSWQSFQLNLPVTSIRDIAFNGDDIIVATHGRAFWILDDASPLRDRVARATTDAYLFAPATAYRLRPGNDEGTPLPMDEPSSKNPPTGAIFDYYLRAQASTPVVLTVTDARGIVASRWSSADKPDVPDPAKADIAPVWLSTPPLPSAAAGAHRFVWDFHYRNGDGPLAAPGRYTVTLEVDGKTFARPLVVLRDPRIAAGDAALRAQFALAQTLEARKIEIAGLQSTAKQLHARDIIGVEQINSPDDSEGKYSHDFTSLRYLGGAYDGLEQVVESGDAAPTADMYTALAKLDAILATTKARLNAPQRAH